MKPFASFLLLFTSSIIGETWSYSRNRVTIANAYADQSTELWVVVVEDQLRTTDANSKSVIGTSTNLEGSGGSEVAPDGIPKASSNNKASFGVTTSHERGSTQKAQTLHRAFKITYGDSHEFDMNEKEHREYMTIMSRPVSSPQSNEMAKLGIKLFDHNNLYAGEMANKGVKYISENYWIKPGRRYIITPNGNIKIGLPDARDPFLDDKLKNWRPDYETKMASRGGECAGECARHKSKYKWCRLTTGGWDYCSTEAGSDYKDRPCKTGHPCGYYGEKYQWCITVFPHGGETWGYCSSSAKRVLKVPSKITTVTSRPIVARTDNPVARLEGFSLMSTRPPNRPPATTVAPGLTTSLNQSGKASASIRIYPISIIII